MGHADTSEAIIARFRAVGLERLDQIESIWVSLMQRNAGEDAGNELLRLLHTLKGEARVLGFVDVHFLCHRLEELVTHADRVNYRVTDDLDMIVMMGMRFVAVLLRKKMGTSLGGIDLAGFARQIDEVLAEAELVAAPANREHPYDARLPATRPPLSGDRISEPTLESLSAIAADIYLECLAADDVARNRLRNAWHALCSIIEGLTSVSLAERVRRHEASAHRLARDLGKGVEVDFHLDHVHVREEIAAALDVVILHGIGNAIDHGIECPEARERAGKDPQGIIRVSARRDRHKVQLSISDDGCGIDRAAIQSRAREGLSDDALLALLFEPGFSTRSEVGAVSGRGVGLNAVKAAVTELGGSARLQSVPGRGTTLLVSIPHRSAEMDVTMFRSSRNDIDVAVPATWQVREAGADQSARDPLEVLAIGTERPASNSFELRRGNRIYVMYVCGPGEKRTVERRCPTPDAHPVEVVWQDNSETLLVRPEVLFAGGGPLAD